MGGEEKRNGRFVGAAKMSKELAEWCRVQWKNLSILGLPKRKEWPQCHRESSWQVCRSCLCQEEKEQKLHKFNFLESIICDDADCEKKIRRRLAMGRSTMIKLTKIMKDDDISVATKAKLFLFPCVFSSDTWQRKLILHKADRGD